MERNQIRYLEQHDLHCEDVESLLDYYLDGELLPALEPRFLRHIESCPLCSELVADCQEIAATARMLGDFPLTTEKQTRLREVLHERCGYVSPLLSRSKLRLVK